MEAIEQRIRQLRALLRRRGQSSVDTDDLIQEAFLRLYSYCQKKEVLQHGAFLTRTALNLSVDMHRRAHRELDLDEQLESSPLVDLRPTPDEELAIAERLIKVAAVLDGLPPRTREIFLMHRVEGYRCAHIARHFKISVSAVEKHIARAVFSLMDVVDHE